MARTLGMPDSVKVLMLIDRRVTISKQLGMSVGIAHKIVHDDLAFSKVSCCWVLPRQCKTSSCSKDSGNYQTI